MRCLPCMPQAGVVVDGRGSDKVFVSQDRRARWEVLWLRILVEDALRNKNKACRIYFM